MLLLGLLGVSVVLVAPPTLMPRLASRTWGVDLTDDFDSVLPDADVAMMLRVQRERMSGGFFPSEREYIDGYGLTPAPAGAAEARRVCRAPRPHEPRARDLIGRRGFGPPLIILDQVSSGVAVRMSVLPPARRRRHHRLTKD